MGVTPTSSHAAGAATGVTKLYDTTVAGSDVASIDTGAASIAGGYSMIQLLLYARSAQAAIFDEVYFQFNADAAANYDWQRVGAANTTGTFSATTGDNGLDAFVPGALAAANFFGAVHMAIPNYAGTVGFKAATWQDGGLDTTTSNDRAFTRQGQWRSTSAITRVKVVSLNAANLKVGSRLIVYGYS